MNLWDHEKPASSYSDDIRVPPWIDQNISPATIAAIRQGGCESGAYIPAVTYHYALQTMSNYGDDILQYLLDNFGELPNPCEILSSSGLACFYLSCAVELWCSDAESILYNLEVTE